VLAELISSAVVVSSTPIWVYIIGAGGSSAAIFFGAWALYARVRQERDKEIKERVENTSATNSNTKALEELKDSFDKFILADERRWRQHDEEHKRQDEFIRRMNGGGGSRH
jgi:hypothetical protein